MDNLWQTSDFPRWWWEWGRNNQLGTHIGEIQPLLYPLGDYDEIPLAYVQICWSGHSSTSKVEYPICYDLIVNVPQMDHVHGPARPWQHTHSVSYMDIPDAKHSC